MKKTFLVAPRQLEVCQQQRPITAARHRSASPHRAEKPGAKRRHAMLSARRCRARCRPVAVEIEDNGLGPFRLIAWPSSMLQRRHPPRAIREGAPRSTLKSSVTLAAAGAR
jgi:hypothetical protein